MLVLFVSQRTDVLKWPREFPTDVPQQQNGYDCGVFTLLFANYAVRINFLMIYCICPCQLPKLATLKYLLTTIKYNYCTGH
jgi:hypothetical protein